MHGPAIAAARIVLDGSDGDFTDTVGVQITDGRPEGPNFVP